MPTSAKMSGVRDDVGEGIGDDVGEGVGNDVGDDVGDNVGDGIGLPLSASVVRILLAGNIKFD